MYNQPEVAIFLWLGPCFMYEQSNCGGN